MTIFIPNKDRNGVEIDQDRWVNEALVMLGTLFRGATAYPRGRGVWRDEAGTFVFEEPVTVFSYAPQDSMNAAALLEIRRFANRMGRETNQGEIGIVIDEVYYAITDYSEV